MRVAVCISGQARSYKTSAALIRKHIIEPLNADVFVHTWSKTGMTTKLSQYLPDTITRSFDVELALDQSDFFSTGIEPPFAKRFPALFDRLKYITSSGSNVSAEDISQAFNAKVTAVEDQDSINLTNEFDMDLLRATFVSPVLNTLPMYYKIWACDQLRQSYQNENGFIYDAVIRMRPDFVLRSNITADMLRPPNGVATFLYPPLEQSGAKDNVFDGFAVGTDSGMRHYAEIWRSLPRYWSAASIEGWPELSSRGAERCLYYHLREIGAADDILRPDPPIARVIDVLPFTDVIELMLLGMRAGAIEDVAMLDLINQSQSLEAINIGLREGWELGEEFAAHQWPVGNFRSQPGHLFRGVRNYCHGEFEAGKNNFGLAFKYSQYLQYPDFDVMYGVCLRECGDHELAIKHFNRSIKKNLIVASAYYNRGILHDRLGRGDMARHDFLMALSIEPSNEIFRGSAARFLT